MSKLTFRNLCDRFPSIALSSIAERASLFDDTISNMLNGRPVLRSKAERVLRALSGLAKRNWTLDTVDIPLGYFQHMHFFKSHAQALENAEKVCLLVPSCLRHRVKNETLAFFTYEPLTHAEKLALHSIYSQGFELDNYIDHAFEEEKP